MRVTRDLAAVPAENAPENGMTEIEAFFAMGGYAAFVWPSLGLTLAVMLGLLVQTLYQLHSRRRRLEALEAQGAKHRRRDVSVGPERAPGGRLENGPLSRKAGQ